MAANKAIVGLVSTQRQAENIVRTLQLGGFSNDAISVLLPDKLSEREQALEPHAWTPDGTLARAGAGGAIGGTLGLLLGLGVLAVPGLGPLIVAGPIVATLTSAATGAAIGGITGALVGLGIPEHDARNYEGKIVRGGSILISVHTLDAEERARAKYILEAGGADDLVTVGEQRAPRTQWLSAQP